MNNLGFINIDFVTNEMLYTLKFTEHNHVNYSGGYWDEIGTPVPDYPFDGPWVYQMFNNDCPNWAHDIKNMFSDKLIYSMVAINLLKPGRFIPPHRDKFVRLLADAKKNDLNTENLVPVRINIFLQNHIPGHFFEMNNSVFTNYQKGNYSIIHKNVIHSVANISQYNRYAMQITGFAREDLI